MSNDWPSFTPESLADLLAAHVDVTNAYLARIRRPTPESVLALARAEPALYDAYSAAYMYLGSGMDHMAAIVSALRATPLPYLASYTLNRAVLEAAARAFWLTQEGLGTGTRIARALLDRMDSVWSDFQLYPRGDPRHAEARAHLKKRTDRILRQAQEAHLRVHRYGDRSDRAGQPQQLGNEQRPGGTKAVDSLLEWVYGKRHGWFYSHLSGFAHSSIYAMLQGAEVVEDHDGGFKVVQAQVDMVQLSTTTIACAHCHSSVLRLLCKAAGYSDSPESPLETVKSE